MKNKNLFVLLFFFSVVVFNIYLYLHANIELNEDRKWVKIGEHLYKYGVYSLGVIDPNGYYIPTFYTPPIYPIICFVVFCVFGIDQMAYDVIQIISILMNFGIVYFTYRIGKLFSYKIGCVAALLAALDLSLFHWAYDYIVPDTILAFFSIISLFFLVKFIKDENSYKNLILSSLFLCIASWTKTSIFMLWLPLTVFLLVYLYMHKRTLTAKKIYLLISFFVIMQIVFWGGWKIRNYYVTGYPEFSCQAGEVALFWNSPYLISYQEGVSFSEAARMIYEKYITDEEQKLAEGELDEGALNLYKLNIAKKIILESPVDYAVVILRRIPKLLLGSPPPDWLFNKEQSERIYEKYSKVPSQLLALKELLAEGYIFYVFLWGFIKVHLFFVYFMSLVSIVVIFYKNRSDMWVLIGMLLIVIYFVTVSSPPSHDRYRGPIMPIFYFLSGYGLIWLGKAFQQFINSRANLIKPESLNKDNVL